MRKNCLFVMASMCSLVLCLVLCSAQAQAAVVISGVETWDGVSNPHAADGVTLDAGVYTIPAGGITFSPDSRIDLWSHANSFGNNPTATDVTFNFPAGNGGITFVGNSGFDIMAGSRARGGLLTFNMNNNAISASSPTDGFIYNCVGVGACGEFGGTAGSMVLTINSQSNISLGRIITTAPDAGNDTLNITTEGHLQVDQVKTNDPAGGGNAARDMNLTARSMRLGTLDASSDRGAGDQNNGNITLKALAPPGFDPNSNANSVFNNNITIYGPIKTNGAFSSGLLGNVTITAPRVIFEPTMTLNLEEFAVMEIHAGTTVGGFTQAQLFVDQANTGQTALFDVVHDPTPPPQTTWASNASGDWNSLGNWTLGTPSTGTRAVFGAAVTARQTMFLDTDATTRGVEFATANSVVIAGRGTLTIDTTAANVKGTISATQGSHEFQSVVKLNKDTDANIAGSTVEFNNSLNLNGKTLTKTGGGTLNINNRLVAGGGGSIVNNGGVIGGAGAIGGNLTNNSGGTVAPGTSPGMLTVTGNYTQQAGASLRIELGGTQRVQQYDVLNVLGSATLGGTLDVVLINGFTPASGQSFDILDFASVSGNFSALNLPAGVSWNTSSLLTTGTLSVGSGSTTTGDFDGDGDADGGDFALWSANFGLSSGATRGQGNSDGDGDVDGADFLVWQQRFGRTSGAAGAAPEPSAIALVLVAGLFTGRRRR